MNFCHILIIYANLYKFIILHLVSSTEIPHSPYS
jgi:hypothetical protein